MIHNILVLFCAIASAFAYRIRGGGWFTFSTNIICRAIWGGAVAYDLLLIQNFTSTWTQLLMIFVAAYASMYVPHAFCQNMGRWGAPQKKWPAFFVPTLLQGDWDAMPIWQRSTYDAAEMAGVAFFRGLIVFIPLGLMGLFTGASVDLFGIIGAILTITALQPIAYLIGWIIPVTATTELPARSASWGEFLTGAAWAIAIAQL